MAEMRKSYIKVHKRQECPGCGRELDSMTAISHDDAPFAGAICVCIGCGKPLQYDGEKLIECDVTKLPFETVQLIGRLQVAIQRLTTP